MQGNQHRQALDSPKHSLLENFHNPTGWFHGSSAEQTVLKEDISCAFFLEQLVQLQQGPGEVMKGIRNERLPFKDQATLWPLPQYPL